MVADLPLSDLPDFVSQQGLSLIAHRLRRLSELFLGAYGKWLPDLGVSAPPRALSTMLLLEQRGAIGIMEIAARIRLSHPLIIKLVAELEGRELVKIERDPGDARRRLISLTSAGLKEAALINDALKIMERAYTELFAEVGADMLGVVTRLESACDQNSFELRLHQAASAANSEKKETDTYHDSDAGAWDVPRGLGGGAEPAARSANNAPEADDGSFSAGRLRSRRRDGVLSN